MHQMGRALKVQAFTEGHPLPSFNDAAVDLISSCFTGRHEDVQFITNAFASPTGSAPARYTIWGMPGLGKSQLGLKYAHSSFESGRHTHIFAISATTVEKLTQGLTGVLELVQHPARHNPDQAVQLTAARHCFEHSEKYGFANWLISLDNATSETVAFLRLHIPRQNSNGSILITTRTLEIAEALTTVAGQQHPICELKALSPADSAKLLLKRAGIHSSAPADLESAQKLVQRIGCLPLAVDQAGAFMKTNEFQSADRLNDLYDKHGSGEIIRWKNTLTTYEQTSVLAAFTVQFEQLGATNPDVLSFLRVLACLDPENIPLDILVLGAERTREQLASNTESTPTGSPGPKRNRFSVRKFITKLPGKRTKLRPLAVLPSVKVPLELIPLLDSICSEEWLRKACGHLKDFSLAQPLYGEKTSLHIHDLIQQVVTQQTTAAHDSREHPYHDLAVTLLSQAFPTKGDIRSPQSWAQCERVVPHVMALVNHIGALPIGLLSVLSVRVAWYFVQRGRYEEAVALYQQVLEGQTHQLGAEHLDTLHTVDSLADVYERQGKYDDAETLYQRALAGREQQLGADHRATLGTVNDLAIVYWRQEKYAKAEALYQRALAGREQQLGADHPDTLDTVNNLALLYQLQGKYNEAQPLYQRALAGYERQLGPDHPNTLGTVNNLAGLYSVQGNYVEAETLYRRALAGKERQLGPDHPSTLIAVHNIAMLHGSQGKYDEAEILYKRALAGFETSLGIHHPSTIETMYGLAHVYDVRGRDGEAETLLARAEEAERFVDDTAEALLEPYACGSPFVTRCPNPMRAFFCFLATRSPRRPMIMYKSIPNISTPRSYRAPKSIVLMHAEPKVARLREIPPQSVFLDLEATPEDLLSFGPADGDVYGDLLVASDTDAWTV
ncbi:TPR-like protein [Athelia psychrophila]|uniref:TPR-like protein n=1 Tax=Athelia psychrophila TaxID=1759441 RepID=A0A166MW36_9AGAM|nr:TPR-like protein [Fibularhizoctonia sp. CBS 109695]